MALFSLNRTQRAYAVDGQFSASKPILSGAERQSYAVPAAWARAIPYARVPTRTWPQFAIFTRIDTMAAVTFRPLCGLLRSQKGNVL